MSAKIEPRSGLFYGWSYGENGWNAGMDANLLRLGRFGFHLSAKSRLLNEPPTTPEEGDVHIIGPAPVVATEWEGRAAQVAVWDGTQWLYAQPRTGWVCYIEDEEVLSAYKAAGWSVGIAI